MLNNQKIKIKTLNYILKNGSIFSKNCMNFKPNIQLPNKLTRQILKWNMLAIFREKIKMGITTMY